MKTLGFISAGVAHPIAKVFSPSNGANPYQFALSPKDLLNIRSGQDWEDLTDAAAIEEIRKLPALVRVGSLKERFKNLGGSKVIGRPVTNGAFVISTGVQKLVVTAMGSGKVGDVSWRFPGVVHVTDGFMDQCLVRAPAQIYMYSGHGWDVSAGGKAYALINCYPKDNLAAFNDPAFCPYFASYLPGDWPEDVRAVDTNKVILAEKWKKEELRMQWLFLVGCEVLNHGQDPFKKFHSNSGTFGTLLLKQLGVKGVLGFSEHGFTSASLMKRFVERAATTGISTEWLKVYRDDEARAYTWYETNETYGRSHQKSFNDLQKIIPAYMVRKENLGDRLTPATLQVPVGKDLVEFNDLENGKAAGTFSE